METSTLFLPSHLYWSEWGGGGGRGSLQTTSSSSRSSWGGGGGGSGVNNLGELEPVILGELELEPVILGEPELEPVILCELELEPVILGEPELEPFIPGELETVIFDEVGPGEMFGLEVNLEPLLSSPWTEDLRKTGLLTLLRNI